MTVAVAVIGARGAMGTVARGAIEAADDLELVAQVNRGDPVDRTVRDAGAQVAIDLTHPDAVMANVEACVRNGVHVVVGTSGMDRARIEQIGRWLAEAPAVGVLVVPNFSVGAVLMMRFAAEAAPYFASVEIVELHRATKPDAPSGTAYRTAELVAAARLSAGSSPLADATGPLADATGPPADATGPLADTTGPLADATGPLADSTGHASYAARGADVFGVRVHSVRLRGLLAHQEVLLGTDGEVLTIRHDSLDRSSFAPGIVLAVRSVLDRPGVTVGLEHVLDGIRPT